MKDLTRAGVEMDTIETTEFEVEKWGFKEHADSWGAIRKVTVPTEELDGRFINDLEVIFYYGQNDFQERPTPSTSVGDVIRFDIYRFLVCSTGFKLLKPGEESSGLMETSHKVSANI